MRTNITPEDTKIYDEYLKYRKPFEEANKSNRALPFPLWLIHKYQKGDESNDER